MLVYFLFFISALLNVLLVAYLASKDKLYLQHIEKLERKILAKDLPEYDASVADEMASKDSKNTIAEEDKIVDLEQIPNPFNKLDEIPIKV